MLGSSVRETRRETMLSLKLPLSSWRERGWKKNEKNRHWKTEKLPRLFVPSNPVYPFDTHSRVFSKNRARQEWTRTAIYRRLVSVDVSVYSRPFVFLPFRFPSSTTHIWPKNKIIQDVKEQIEKERERERRNRDPRPESTFSASRSSRGVFSAPGKKCRKPIFLFCSSTTLSDAHLWRSL